MHPVPNAGIKGRLWIMATLCDLHCLGRSPVVAQPGTVTLSSTAYVNPSIMFVFLVALFGISLYSQCQPLCRNNICICRDHKLEIGRLVFCRTCSPRQVGSTVTPLTTPASADTVGVLRRKDETSRWLLGCSVGAEPVTRRLRPFIPTANWHI